MTTENNKIIAEFMGFIPITENNLLADNFNVKEEEKLMVIEFTKYHSDWNWLMQVVEKIETHGFTFDIKKNWSCITRKGEKIIIRWEEDNNKIEAVYNACVEFIKWYNENKSHL